MTGPLVGRTVLVTRPAHQAAVLAQAIRTAGGTAFEFPALAIEAVPLGELAAPLAQLAGADIAIFISPNAAQFGRRRSCRRRTAGAVRFLQWGRHPARTRAQCFDDVAMPRPGQRTLCAAQLMRSRKRVGIVRGVAVAHCWPTRCARAGAGGFSECYRGAFGHRRMRTVAGMRQTVESTR